MARWPDGRDGAGAARRRRLLPIVPLVVLGGLLAQLAGCSADSPSTLETNGPGADRIASFWWLLFWISVAVFVLVTALVVWAVWRRRGEHTKVHLRGGEGLVIAGGIILPVVVLSGVYVIGLDHQAFLARTPSDTDLTIEVTGHDWWWEVTYPDQGFTTANEIHVPVGEPVKLLLRSADVVHSFWVPELVPKTDMIPGQTNESWLRADHADTYRGQCAEYCGLQHARMALLVTAHEPGAFDEWIENEQQPAAAPGTELAARGQEVFERSSCAACHTVRGTSADGEEGPDLTHFGGRETIGAVTVPNDRGHLSGWIVDSQRIKPGNLMPPQPLDPDELQALIAYMESLR